MTRRRPLKLSKRAVRYRPASGLERCGSCAMFHPRRRLERCDLVRGVIRASDVCDRFIAKLKEGRP